MANARQFMAARTAAFAKSGGWVNPYVTDGLIAMWDGEWNAGGGVHLDSISSIKDLVGNNDFQIYGNPTIEDKFINFRGASYAYGDNGELCKFVNNDFTIEGVFHCGNYVDSRPYFSILSGTDSADRNRAITMYAGDGYIAYVLQIRSNYNYPRQEIDAKFGFSIRVKGNLVKANFNNISYINFRAGTEVYSSSNTTLTIATWQWNYLQRMMDCKMGSFRIYSRTIDEDERAANYAIDKARFNLPNAA